MHETKPIQTTDWISHHCRLRRCLPFPPTKIHVATAVPEHCEEQKWGGCSQIRRRKCCVLVYEATLQGRTTATKQTTNKQTNSKQTNKTTNKQNNKKQQNQHTKKTPPYRRQTLQTIRSQPSHCLNHNAHRLLQHGDWKMVLDWTCHAPQPKRFMNRTTNSLHIFFQFV